MFDTFNIDELRGGMFQLAQAIHCMSEQMVVVRQLTEALHETNTELQLLRQEVAELRNQNGKP